MENLITKLVVPLIKAWNLFFEIPIPLSANLKNQVKTLSHKYDNRVLYAIPVLGLITGIIAYLFIWFIYLFFGTLFASILCSIVIILFCEVFSYGKYTNRLVHILTDKTFAVSGKTKQEQQNLKENSFLFIYIFIAIFLFKVLCLSFIIYSHHFCWIILFTTLVLSIQGSLSAGDTTDSLIQITGKSSILYMWIITAVICFLFGYEYLLATIIAYILTLLFSLRYKKHLSDTYSLTKLSIGVAGKYMEILMLIIGLISITRY